MGTEAIARRMRRHLRAIPLTGITSDDGKRLLDATEPFDVRDRTAERACLHRLTGSFSIMEIHAGWVAATGNEEAVPYNTLVKWAAEQRVLVPGWDPSRVERRRPAPAAEPEAQGP